jgi:hypothetical protein
LRCKNVKLINTKCIKLFRLEQLFSTLSTHWILVNCLIQPTHNLVVVSIWYLKKFFFKKCLSQNETDENGKNDVYEKEAYQWRRKFSLNQIVLLFFIISQSCYFTQGNSNSLNTIPIQSGLVGVNYLNELIVALLLTSATYSANIFWHFSSLEFVLFNQVEKEIVLINCQVEKTIKKNEQKENFERNKEQQHNQQLLNEQLSILKIALLF